MLAVASVTITIVVLWRNRGRELRSQTSTVSVARTPPAAISHAVVPNQATLRQEAVTYASFQKHPFQVVTASNGYEWTAEDGKNTNVAMNWLSAHDSNNDGLLEIPEAGDWTDLFGRSYNVLYDEVVDSSRVHASYLACGTLGG